MNHIEISPKYKHLKAYITSLATKGPAESATIIYSARNTIYRDNVDGLDICIKSYKRPGIINRYVYTNIRYSKAHRAFSAARRLLKMGINTPEPIAFIEEKIGGALHKSYYVCVHVKGEEMRFAEQRPDKEQLYEALAREMVKIHGKWVRLRDFSPGNVLFYKDSDGQYVFNHVDINRISFGVTGHFEQFKMFNTILSEDDDIRILATEYATASALPVDDTIHDALAARHRFLKKQHIKAALKKLIGR